MKKTEKKNNNFTPEEKKLLDYFAAMMLLGSDIHLGTNDERKIISEAAFNQAESMVLERRKRYGKDTKAKNNG